MIAFLQSKEPLNILLVGDTVHHQGKETLHQQFPQAHVHELTLGELFTTASQTITKPYHYIYIEPTVGKKHGATILAELHSLLSRVRPDGVICTTVYGYAGYYGLAMLSTILKQFFGDGVDSRHLVDHMSVAQAIVTQIPADHPAHQHREFMARLLQGDIPTFEELLHISPTNVFTVSRLLECIAQNGGRFLDWEFPSLYEPGQHIREKDICETLERLPRPQRWEVSELLNAAPPEHHFYITAP